MYMLLPTRISQANPELPYHSYAESPGALGSHSTKQRRHHSSKALCEVVMLSTPKSQNNTNNLKTEIAVTAYEHSN